MNEARKIAEEVWNTTIPKKKEYDRYLDRFEEKIKEYAVKKCKEQNDICFRSICRALIDGRIPLENLGLWIEMMYKKAPLPKGLQITKKGKK